MPRRPRFATGGYVFHVLNRAVARAAIFTDPADYEAVVQVLGQAGQVVPMRLLGWCLLPNHWHLILWPYHDGDLSEYVRWLTVTHTQRWHATHRTSGTGALYQGRFKSFPIQEDEHLLAVCRYVERNALRAGLVERAEDRRWSSLRARLAGGSDLLAAGPVPLPAEWVEYVNRPETEAERAALRRSVVRGSPFGGAVWQGRAAERLGLQKTLRRPGRPRNAAPRTDAPTLF
jgi:REP-associated tyrosine transposase